MFAPGRPVVMVNYKLYPQATGEAALRLTAALEEAAQGVEATVAVAPQAFDLHRVAQATALPVLAQHVDSVAPGNGTGHSLVEAAQAAGAIGAILNHAEHRLQLAQIEASCHRLAVASMTRVVCTNNVPTTAAAAALGADFVAIEPPELIGGDISVTTADPGIVADAVKAARAVDPNVRVLCGAGVKTGEDVRAALSLGAAGVLLASGVVKVADPGAAMRDLLSGI